MIEKCRGSKLWFAQKSTDNQNSLDKFKKYLVEELK